jgi:type III pantothenate kinase
MIKSYKERFGFLTVLVTGGDAEYFDTESKNTIFADQDLVLKGLNNILNYHHQNI